MACMEDSNVPYAEKPWNNVQVKLAIQPLVDMWIEVECLLVQLFLELTNASLRGLLVPVVWYSIPFSHSCLPLI